MRLQFIKFTFPIMILVGGVLIGCAGSQKVFVPVEPSAENGSVVYIYRPIKAANVMLTPDVSIAGIKTFAMSNGDYKQLYLSPGQHAIKLAAIEGNTPAVEHVLKVVEGRVHYLRVDASMKLEFGQSYQPYKRKFELLNVIANTAVAEISDCIDMDAGEKQKKSAASVEAGDSEETTFSVDKTANPFSH